MYMYQKSLDSKQVDEWPDASHTRRQLKEPPETTPIVSGISWHFGVSFAAVMVYFLVLGVWYILKVYLVERVLPAATWRQQLFYLC